jgi:uncharacterized iron-regulated membrane protein
MSVVVRLHANLLIGDWGKLVMGINALLTLVLTIVVLMVVAFSGVYFNLPQDFKPAVIFSRH